MDIAHVDKDEIIAINDQLNEVTLPIMDDLDKLRTYNRVDNSKAREIILNDLEKYKIVTGSFFLLFYCFYRIQIKGIHPTEEESTSFVEILG